MGKIKKKETMGGVGGGELLVRSGGRIMWYISREKYKEVFYVLLFFQSRVRFVSAHTIDFGMEK
jgi:hypothetical protein